MVGGTLPQTAASRVSHIGQGFIVKLALQITPSQRKWCPISPLGPVRSTKTNHRWIGVPDQRWAPEGAGTMGPIC